MLRRAANPISLSSRRSTRIWPRLGEAAKARTPVSRRRLPLRFSIRNPFSKDLLREGLKISLQEQLHTPSTKGHPIGWTAEDDWKKMLEVLKTYSGVTPKELSAYYTNDFIAQ